MYSPGTAAIPGNPINVLDPKRGVRGDSNSAGTSGTDDAAAINAAIAEAPNGSAVYFPRTSGAGYLLGSALICDHDDISLIFEPGSKLILAPGANSNVIRGNPNSDTATYGVVRKKRIAIQGLYAEMNGASQGNVSGTNAYDGAIMLPAFDVIDLERCYVHNSKNTAYELRGSSLVRARFCVADGVYSGTAGNGFSVGKTGSVNGTDAMLVGCLASGVQDVAFWLGGFGANRMQAIGCDVRGDVTRYVADGAINVGVNAGLLTSATAGFTPNDVGKLITIAGAGPSGATLTCRIFNYISATSVGLSVPASTTVSGVLFSYGADGAPARQVLDAAMSSGSSTVTSATANFTAADIQKGFFIVGAGSGGANKIGKISAVTNSTTATVDFTASTTVSGKVARVNCTSSGISSEGSSGNSRHVSIIGGHTVGTVNVGVGATDASSGTVGTKHDQVVATGFTVADTYGTAAWFTGRQQTIGEFTIDEAHDSGLLLGLGNDFEEGPFTLNGGTITMASDATGKALSVQKDGGNTNALVGVTVNGTILDGNGGGSYGATVEGRVKGVSFNAVQSRRFKKSGAWFAAKGGASPSRIKVLGGEYNNNNQGANTRGQDSVGIACESAADDITIIGATATDDQASKTQTDGLHWLGATRGHIARNDFRGNATGASNTSFDSKTIYSENKEVDADYEGGAVLVAGTVTISTAAVRNSGVGHWTPIDLAVFSPSANVGALYVSAITTGTSFTVKSTNASDTSSFFWRIR